MHNLVNIYKHGMFKRLQHYDPSGKWNAVNGGWTMVEDANDEKKDHRIPFVIGPSLLKRLDEWRFRRHICSRSEAIRVLIEQGISRDDKGGG